MLNIFIHLQIWRILDRYGDRLAQKMLLFDVIARNFFVLEIVDEGFPITLATAAVLAKISEVEHDALWEVEFFSNLIFVDELSVLEIFLLDLVTGLFAKFRW